MRAVGSTPWDFARDALKHPATALIVAVAAIVLSLACQLGYHVVKDPLPPAVASEPAP